MNAKDGKIPNDLYSLNLNGTISKSKIKTLKVKREKMKAKENEDKYLMDFEWLTKLLERAREKEIPNKITGDYSLWNILTALRGPDNVVFNDITNENQRLKGLTTARIRAILGIEEDAFYVRALPLTPDEIIERDELLEKSMRQHPTSQFQNTHFFSHFILAILALRRLGYNIPNDEYDSLIQLRCKIMGI